MSIYRYTINRLMYAVPVLLGVTLFAFIMIHSMPGDPVYVYLASGETVTGATDEMMMRVRHELGLDKPLYIQYLIYLNGLLHGNFGWSLHYRKTVWSCLTKFFPATIELTIVSTFFAFILGIFSGILSAIRRDRIVDYLARIASLIGMSAPIFWLGLMLQIIFYSQLKILPISRRIDFMISVEHPLTNITGLLIFDSLLTGNWPALKSSLAHIILPATVLSLRGMARIARTTRASFLDNLEQDYVRTLRSYGLRERIINFKYVLKSSFIPIATILGLALGESLQGTYLVETVFDWPGAGLFMMWSIWYQDYPAILGIAIITCVIYILINLMIDIFYVFLDPRIQF